MANDSCFYVPASRRKRFTLIELLVVISIIAVLASILLPSLQSAREKGDATTCKNNMMQIGKGLLSYASDWGGVWPACRVPYLKGENHGGMTSGILNCNTNAGVMHLLAGVGADASVCSGAQYVSSFKIGYCPASVAPGTKKEWDSPKLVRGPSIPGRSYGWRWLLDSANRSNNKFMSYRTHNWEPDYQDSKKSRILSFKPFKCPVSADVTFLGDNTGWNGGESDWDISTRLTNGSSLPTTMGASHDGGDAYSLNAIYTIHSKKAHFLFLDGHVDGVGTGDQRLTSYKAKKYFDKNFNVIEWGD